MIEVERIFDHHPNREVTTQIIKDHIHGLRVVATDKQIYNAIGYLARTYYITSVRYGVYTRNNRVIPPPTSATSTP